MGKHLTKNDRIKMETMLNSGHKPEEIAEYLHVHRSTIYREKKRGEYTHRNSDYTEETRYSSDLGQKNHDWNAQGKGRSIKIGKDRPLAEYIENIIINDKYSPEAALAAIAQSGIEFSTTISVRTLYRYIDNGIFLKLTNKDLPIKGKRKKHNKKVKVQKRASAGESIENRPDEVENREIFGHWEMDTVKGKQGVTKSCMLVLTERKTRDEIIAKLPDQKAASVVEALDRLERKWGDMFQKIFKSITVDCCRNGDIMRLLAEYFNGTSCLFIQVKSYQNKPSIQVEKTDAPVETFGVDNTTVYLLENINNNTAVWVTEHYECLIGGAIEKRDLQKMVLSTYTNS